MRLVGIIKEVQPRATRTCAVCGESIEKTDVVKSMTVRSNSHLTNMYIHLHCFEKHRDHISLGNFVLEDDYRMIFPKPVKWWNRFINLFIA